VPTPGSCANAPLAVSAPDGRRLQPSHPAIRTGPTTSQAIHHLIAAYVTDSPKHGASRQTTRYRAHLRARNCPRHDHSPPTSPQIPRPGPATPRHPRGTPARHPTMRTSRKGLPTQMMGCPPRIRGGNPSSRWSTPQIATPPPTIHPPQATAPTRSRCNSSGPSPSSGGPNRRLTRVDDAMDESGALARTAWLATCCDESLRARSFGGQSVVRVGEGATVE
jgi:hypothetical protein